MELLFSPLTNDAIGIISTWRYPSPYERYDVGREALLEAIGNPRNVFYGIYRQSMLIGFCSLGTDGQVPGGDYSKPALDIGIGMAPVVTGFGNGSRYVAAVVTQAIETAAPDMLRVTIAGFNERSIKAWQANGFRMTSRFQSHNTRQDFTILTRSVP